MVERKRNCFVISTIGGHNSPERTQADDFLELIKEVAELHNLNVIRADEIMGTGDINQDIINHVQQADLCIIDLTGLNPNVMYEFGIRYQAKLPYIVCAKMGTTLPFDTTSVRTIFYDDIGTTNESRRVKNLIRNFIQVFERQGYQSMEAVTLTSLYNMLQTVLEKLESIRPAAGYTSNNTANPATEDVDEILRQLDPSEAFRYALTTNQIKLAENLLEYCRDQPFEYIFNKLCALSSRGSVRAADELEAYLDQEADSMAFDSLIEAIACMVSCYNRQDVETAHIDKMEQYFNLALNIAKNNRERASVLNQKQRLLAGAGKFEEAKPIVEQAIKLNDEEAAYYYNYATILRQLKDKDIPSAIESAKKAIELEKEDNTNQLALLCDLLIEDGTPTSLELLERYLDRLEKVNPLRARMIRLRRP